MDKVIDTMIIEASPIVLGATFVVFSLLIFLTPKHKENLWFAGFIGATTVPLLLHYLEYLHLGPLFDQSWLLITASIWLWGPSLWFYVRGKLELNVEGLRFLHFLPAFILIATVALGQELAAPDWIVEKSLILLAFLHLVGYLSLCMVEVRNSELKRATLKSSRFNKRLFVFLLAMLVVVVVDVVSLGLNLVTDQQGANKLFAFVGAELIVGLVFSTAVIQRSLHRDVSRAMAKKRVEVVTNIEPAFAHWIESELNTLMKEKHLYQNPALSLMNLSKEIQVSQSIISDVLIHHMNSSFYQFVNEFRVRGARDRLLDPAFASRTILDIAYSVGFGNKTSFNREFQRCFQVTPAAFRDQHKLGFEMA